MANKRKLVTLVTTEIMTPYKAGEIFSVPEEIAEILLTRNTEKTDFGLRYPKVKVRRFDPRVDGERILDEKTLNIEAHNALQKQLRPDLPEIEKVEAGYTNAITDLLDDAGYVEKEVVEKPEDTNATSPSPRNNRAPARGNPLNSKDD